MTFQQAFEILINKENLKKLGSKIISQERDIDREISAQVFCLADL